MGNKTNIPYSTSGEDKRTKGLKLPPYIQCIITNINYYKLYTHCSGLDKDDVSRSFNVDHVKNSEIRRISHKI